MSCEFHGYLLSKRHLRSRTRVSRVLVLSWWRIAIPFKLIKTSLALGEWRRELMLVFILERIYLFSAQMSYANTATKLLGVKKWNLHCRISKLWVPLPIIAYIYRIALLWNQVGRWIRVGKGRWVVGVVRSLAHWFSRLSSSSSSSHNQESFTVYGCQPEMSRSASRSTTHSHHCPFLFLLFPFLLSTSFLFNDNLPLFRETKPF